MICIWIVYIVDAAYVFRSFRSFGFYCLWYSFRIYTTYSHFNANALELGQYMCILNIQNIATLFIQNVYIYLKKNSTKQFLI